MVDADVDMEMTTAAPPRKPPEPPLTKTDSADAPDNPGPVYAKIPIGELTLAEAADQVDDPSWWQDTMPAVLHFFNVGDYWALTVDDHRRLVAWATAQGLITEADDGDQSET